MKEYVPLTPIEAERRAIAERFDSADRSTTPMRQCTAEDYNDGGPCKNCGYVPRGRNLPEKT
jgi:hypothetical protein